MDNRNELLKKYEILLPQLETFEESITKLTLIKKEIIKVEESPLDALKNFDEEYLTKYIIEEIGEDPQNAPLLEKIGDFILFNSSKKQEEYNHRKEKVIKKYYKEFDKQRDEIHNKELNDKNNLLEKLRDDCRKIETDLQEQEKRLKLIDYIPKEYLTSEAVKSFIDYLENNRASTLIELINTYCLEQKIQRHFQKLENHLKKVESVVEELSEKLEENSLIVEELQSEMIQLNLKIDS